MLYEMPYIRNVFNELIIKFVSPLYKDACFLIPHSLRDRALPGYVHGSLSVAS